MKIFYVRMECTDFVDLKVLAKNKEAAARLAEANGHMCIAESHGFVAGEVSATRINSMETECAPTEDEPVILDE